MSETTASNASVDFLPAHYRERSTKRRTDLWRLGVVAVLGSVVAGTALAAHRLHCQAQTELATVDSLHGHSNATTKKVAELQAQLQPLQARAELLTYLRFPWPKSQILAAVVGPLPREITLVRLHVLRENNDKVARQEPARAPQAAAAASAAPKVTDLERLRSECDPQKCVVQLAGTVTEPTALYEYLGRLNDLGLFERVELGPVEQAAGQGPISFTARLTLRPGYGQPGQPLPTAPRPGAPAVASHGAQPGVSHAK